MRPFIQTITSNIKQPDGTSRETDLGKHTLLLGPNRSGKTAIIQAMELAATGAVDDVMGRDEVKLDKTLLSLVPVGTELVAKAEFTHGAVNSYHKEASSKAVFSAETFCHPVHRIARKALSGSTAKLEEAVLEWSSLKGVDRNYVVDLLPNKVRARYLDIADRMSRSAGGEGELLLMIADYAAKEQRKLSAEIKTLKGVMNAMSDCCETTDGHVDEKRLVGAVLDTVQPLTHLQKSATWAAESGVDQCPTCGSQVGNTHVKACADHLNGQQTEAADLTPVVSTIESLLHDRIMWSYVVKYKREIESLTQRHDAYKDLKNHCLGVVSLLVKSYRGDFCASVNRFLPDTWELQYSDEQGALGLAFDGGAVMVSLSGTEWVTLVTAVSCAAADTYSDSAAILLVVEDRAWDPETLASVMRSLSKFDGQVVMQSTIKPKGRTPKGWTVVETDRSEPAPKEISPLSKSMMESLGYSDEDIDVMSSETLQELMEKAIVRNDVILKSDGSWESA